MPLHGTTGPASTEPLWQRVPQGASASQVAAALGAITLELDAALSPIIGPRGVMALWQRSLQLTSATYPWLAAGQSGGLTALDRSLLAAAVGRCDAAAAAASVNALLLAFHDLLASLIGPSLTERLLRTVWAPSPAPTSSGLPAQDPTP